MTNVKLKLMFFLLNALLTADIVHARPYSDDNNTDIIINYANSNNFSLSVDSYSDTLTAANDDDDDNEDHPDETPEETNKSSNTQMEAIMNAEQDRDEDLSKKKMKEGSILEIHKDDAAALEQQRNISSPLLDRIIDSETDREETLTDILFRPDAELVETPRFEFLIAAKINESDSSNKSVSGSGNGLESRNNSDVLMKKLEYVELMEVFKPKMNHSALRVLNITGHDVEGEVEPETILSVFSGFSDLQTWFLACFATLLPLLAVLIVALIIRCISRRLCPGMCTKALASTETDSSLKDDNNEEMKFPLDENGGLAGDEDGEDVSTPASNGSIFTMTLKNNHLIVETEERNDIARNGRETKMKYSPDNDGIFVVEVQQSTAYRPSKSVQNSPPNDPQISTNQALIHRIPEELEKKLEDSENSRYDKEKAIALSSTGLSISDLSMSSLGSRNVSYTYGSQTGYDHGHFGYPIYVGYDTSKDDLDCMIHENSQEPLITKTPTDPDRPLVTSAILKQDSIIGNDVMPGSEYCIEGSSDGPLLSDVQAREVSLQNLHDKKESKILENGSATIIGGKDKHALGRAESVHLEDIIKVEDNNGVMGTITEDEIPVKDILQGKRASLPVIRTDNMYESVKDAIIPSGSPKFEKCTNESSPCESGIDNAPPMITITEENEPNKLDNDS